MKKDLNNKTIIIATGGTGGHIYPTLVLKEEWKKRYPKSSVLFVGSLYGMERSLFLKHQLHYYLLKTKGIRGKSLFEKIESLMLLLSSLFISFRIIKKYSPAAVIGAGGYASASICIASIIKRIPLLLLEENYNLGYTNQWLSKFAKGVALGLPNAELLKNNKFKLTGNPVRQEFIENNWNYQPFQQGYFGILIFGGSQGSHNLNNFMIDALPYLKQKKEALFIMHQTGLKDYITIKNLYDQEGFKTDIQPYFDKIYEQYKKADLVIARSGASTISEILISGRPCILIPLMVSGEAHQAENAKLLHEKEIAWVLDERKMSGKILSQLILHALNNPEELKIKSQKAKELAKPNAAKEILDWLDEIISK